MGLGFHSLFWAPVQVIEYLLNEGWMDILTHWQIQYWLLLVTTWVFHFLVSLFWEDLLHNPLVRLTSLSDSPSVLSALLCLESHR